MYECLEMINFQILNYEHAIAVEKEVVIFSEDFQDGFQFGSYQTS